MTVNTLQDEIFIQRLETLLKEEAEVFVNFTKANGELREMRCTLKAEELLSRVPPVTDNKKTVEREPNPAVVTVWDLDKNGWRAFRKDSVKTYFIPEAA